MKLVFLEPTFLWLLILVPLLWFLPRRAVDWRHAAIRACVAGLMILALARPALLKTLSDPYQVIVWDRSESIGNDKPLEVKKAVTDLLEGLPADSHPRIVALNGATGDAPTLEK